MLVLGIELPATRRGWLCSSYPAPGQGYAAGLLAQALHSQVDMHAEYGGVVPELASRDHIRRVLPLARQVLSAAGRGLSDIDGIAYTEGPGLAGALLVGASMASGLAYALGVPAVGIHHLEGHLLSPLLAPDPPAFPFVALLVSGGHTQLMHVAGSADMPCSARPWTTPPAKRSTRPRSCSGWAIRAARARQLAEQGRRAGSNCHDPCSPAAISTSASAG